MRRSEESQQDDFKESVELGKENAECIRQMLSWCKNAEIKREGGGLYQQMTGLPIGLNGIGCQFVEGESLGMDLKWIFSTFLVQHCANCPHHTPNGDASWGQKVIDHYREQASKRDRAAKEEADRISALRGGLLLKSKEMNAESDPEAHRILEFFELLFSEDETKRKEASERLKQSAQLGAELFPDAAIDLVLVLASSNEFSKLILPVCSVIAGKRSELSLPLAEMALVNIEKGLNPELSASVLEQLGDAVSYPLEEMYIKGLIQSQVHSYPVGGWMSGKPDYSQSTKVIVRSFDADEESVQKFVRRQLQNEDKDVRVQVCGALELVQKERPQIVVNLLGDLVRSMELYERDRYGESPSRKIARILAESFRRSPQRIDEFLVESISRVRPTVQEDIINVYQEQFIDRTVGWNARKDQRNRSEVSENESVAIQRLLKWMKDEDLEIDIRADALEALEMACKYATTEMLNHFDSLFGYYAIICGEENPPAAPPKIILPGEREDAQLEKMDEALRVQEWQTFKQRLEGCLLELCEARPTMVLPLVLGYLNQPLDKLDVHLKGFCVLLLGKIGKDYQMRAQVIPQIWRAIMDYSSAWTQAKAIEASVEVFSSSSVLPPANLLDIIIIYLRDEKVVLHKTALRAVTNHPSWFNDERSLRILNSLSGHLQAYRDEPYQLDDICEGILSVGSHRSRLKAFALKLVESVFLTGEELVDSKIAERLIWFCEPGEQIAQHVAKDIAMHLAHHNRDRFNSYSYSGRDRMFQWLHKLPLVTYQAVASDLLIFARRLASRDAWESCHFASLFAQFRTFEYERNVLETALGGLPDEPRHKPFWSTLSRLSTLAAGNTLLQAGKAEEAKMYFNKLGDES